MLKSNLVIRKVTKADESAVISLIDTVYNEYGDKVFLKGSEADLCDLEHAYSAQKGAFWVAQKNSKIVGTAAVKIKDESSVELKRFYLQKDCRGSGIADKLLAQAEKWSKENQLTTLFFWSDVRFERAHVFYEKRGYNRGRIREMTDGSMPYSEYYYEKNLK